MLIPVAMASFTNVGAGGCKCRNCQATGKNVRRLQKVLSGDIGECAAKCSEFSWCQSCSISGSGRCVMHVAVGVPMPSLDGWRRIANGLANPDGGFYGNSWVDQEVTEASGDTNQAPNCWKRVLTLAPTPAPTPAPMASFTNLGVGGCKCSGCQAADSRTCCS